MHLTHGGNVCIESVQPGERVLYSQNLSCMYDTRTLRAAVAIQRHGGP